MSAFFREHRQAIRIGLTILLLLLIGLAGTAGWRIYRSATAGAVTLKSSPEEGECGLGTALVLQYTFTVPWGQSIGKMDLQPSAGWVVARPPEIRTVRRQWGSSEVAVEMTLRAYRTGSGSPGTLTVAVQQEYAKPERRQPPMSLAICDFTVTAIPVDPAAELPLAEPLALPESSHPYRWWIVGGTAFGLLAVLIVLWLWFRRRRSLPPPEPWEIAARELAELRRDAGSGGRSAAWCFGRLTDVVRDYLSRRFRLHADRQTTEEFLYAMARGNSPLDPVEERALEAFLQQADLIKFAGQLPENGAFDRAIGHAEELVRVTTPVRKEAKR